MNYRQVKARQEAAKKSLLKVNPHLPERSGIYIFTRKDSNGFKYAYIGQAKHILTRLAQHLMGYEQHIDRSLKSHGLYDRETRPDGWNVAFAEYGEESLNMQEQVFIKYYADLGYQLLNKTSGSQGVGKVGIAANKPSRGYYDGLKQGYKNAQKEVAHWFEKSLDFSIKGNPNKNKEKAFENFSEFIRGEK